MPAASGEGRGRKGVRRIRIGLIGDRNPAVRAHAAIPRALEAAAGPGIVPEIRWLPTSSLARDAAAEAAGLDGLWCVPGSPYASLEGALAAIRFARESSRPFLGTCGGFQHALLEYARNVLGISGADHAESNPSAAIPLISPLACSLAGKKGRVHFRRGSRVAVFYGSSEAVEEYQCSFGLNPKYAARFDDGRLSVTGVDDDGNARVVEMNEHPFFLATLFQPELSALRKGAPPHPLIAAFLSAVRACAARAGDDPER